MEMKIRNKGKTRSVPGAMAISAAVSMGLTVLVSAGIAYALNVQKTTWEQVGYWIMGMLFAAAFLGAKAAVRAAGSQRGMVSMMAGLMYWGLLLCVTALFFGGNYDGIWVTAGIILGGCGASFLLSGPGSGRRSVKKGRRNR